MIYFDNSATTPLCDEAKTAMLEAMEIYGNPSSLHTLGEEAEKCISAAKKTILAALGVRCVTKLDERRLIFTASGTEADNLAITGVAMAKYDTARAYMAQSNGTVQSTGIGKKIITSDSEHPAVLETLKNLEARGFTVIRIGTKNGVPDYDKIAEVADRNTILATFMLVNNETGAVYDIAKIASIVKAANPSAVIHTDCVQGFLKIPFTAKSLGADMITLSSHKINGAKGVGALYVSESVLKARALSPVIFGGGQESGYRSGTENTIGIASFAAATKAGRDRFAEVYARENEIREYLIRSITEKIPEVRPNLPEHHAPHILSLTLPNIRSETALHYLSQSDIYVSSGSACSSNTGHGSYVLTAYGLLPSEADTTIRVSFGYQNTLAEADIFVEALAGAVKTLVRRQ